MTPAALTPLCPSPHNTFSLEGALSEPARLSQPLKTAFYYGNLQTQRKEGGWHGNAPSRVPPVMVTAPRLLRKEEKPRPRSRAEVQAPRLRSVTLSASCRFVGPGSPSGKTPERAPQVAGRVTLGCPRRAASVSRRGRGRRRDSRPCPAPANQAPPPAAPPRPAPASPLPRAQASGGGGGSAPHCPAPPRHGRARGRRAAWGKPGRDPRAGAAAAAAARAPPAAAGATAAARAPSWPRARAPPAAAPH